MRTIAALFFGFLVTLFGVWFGDIIDKSDSIPKTNNNVIDKTIEATKTADYYISMGEVVCAGGALVTGVISFITRNKP